MTSKSLHTKRTIGLLFLALALSSCETEMIVTPAEGYKVVHIKIESRSGFVGDTMVISSHRDSLTKDRLLYYWLLGDDSSFSASQESFYHVYKKPGFYQITLTIRRAEDFTLVNCDTAIVEIIDTNILPTASLGTFRRVECDIKGIFARKLNNRDTLQYMQVAYPYEISPHKFLRWETDSFYVSDKQSQSDESSRSWSYSGSSSAVAGSILKVNGTPVLIFSHVGSSYSKAGSTGYQTQTDRSWMLQVHLLPLITGTDSLLVFGASGRNAFTAIKSDGYSDWFSGSVSGQYSASTEYRTIAPAAFQTDSSSIQIRFIK